MVGFDIVELAPNPHNPAPNFIAAKLYYKMLAYKFENELKIAKNMIKEFIKDHYKHFNAAALIDASEAYVQHLEEGGKMMITLAGAMSTG